MKKAIQRTRAAAALRTLGADPKLLDERGLPIFSEAHVLHQVGIGGDGRDKFLGPSAAEPWR